MLPQDTVNPQQARPWDLDLPVPQSLLTTAPRASLLPLYVGRMSSQPSGRQAPRVLLITKARMRTGP